MDSMLGKIMKLVVTVRDEYLATLVDLLEKVTGRDAEKWIKNLRLFLRKETVDWSEKVTTFLRVVKTGIPVNKTERVRTASCFKKGFACRDSNIDSWMTENVTAMKEGFAVCYELTEDGHTFMEMAHELLSIDTKNRTHSEALIAKTLIESGKTFSLKQVEDLHKRFVAGETEIGFLENGYANFFFVHDDKGRVFVLFVDLASGGWSVDVDRLGNSYLWRSGRRLFSRN